MELLNSTPLPVCGIFCYVEFIPKPTYSESPRWQKKLHERQQVTHQRLIKQYDDTTV